MDRPRDHALARAAFAGDKHRRPRVGHAGDHLEHLQHPRVAADDVVHPVAAVELLAEVVVFAKHGPLRQGPLDRHQQLIVDERLGDVVERPGANRLDRPVRRAVAGHKDHLRTGPIAAALLEQIEAVAILQPHVGQHQVERLLPQPVQRIGIAGRRVQLVALAAEPIAHRLEHVAVVVNQQEL